MGVKKELSFTINDCEKLQKGIATIINAKNKR
jgi:hypothetical protein